MLGLTFVVCGVSPHGQPPCGELELARFPLASGPGQLLPPGSKLFFHRQSKRSTVSPSPECKPLATAPSWSYKFSQNPNSWLLAPPTRPQLPCDFPVQVPKASSAICLKGGQRRAGHKSPGRTAPFQAGVKGKTDTPARAAGDREGELPPGSCFTLPGVTIKIPDSPGGSPAIWGQ